MILFIVGIILAILVSYLPEYFLSKGWREKKVREVLNEAKQESNMIVNL
jgi:hypothetical protein